MSRLRPKWAYTKKADRTKRSEAISGAVARAFSLSLLGRVADGLFYIVLFRELMPDAVGEFSWAMAVAAFAGVALDFGLTQTLIREFARRSISIARAAVYSLVIRAPIIILGGVGWLAWNAVESPAPVTAYAVALVCVSQILLTVQAFVQAWFRANLQPTIANGLAVLDPVGRVSVIALIIAVSPNIDLIPLLWGLLGAQVGVTFIHIVYVSGRGKSMPTPSDSKGNVSNLDMRALLLAGGTFTFIALLGVVQNRLDWLLLGATSEPETLANYALANKAYEISLAILGVAVLFIYPRLCSAKRTKRDNVINLILMASTKCLGLALAFSGAFFAPVAIAIIFNGQYNASHLSVTFLLLLVAPQCLVMIRFYQLISVSSERSVLLAAIPATIAQASVNVAFIPHLGILGCLAGMSVLALINLGLYNYIAVRKSLLTTAAVLAEIYLLIGLSVTAALLSTFGVGPLLAAVLLGILSLTGGYCMLLPRRAKKWAISYATRKVGAVARATSA